MWNTGQKEYKHGRCRQGNKRAEHICPHGDCDSMGKTCAHDKPTTNKIPVRTGRLGMKSSSAQELTVMVGAVREEQVVCPRVAPGTSPTPSGRPCVRRSRQHKLVLTGLKNKTQNWIGREDR